MLQLSYRQPVRKARPYPIAAAHQHEFELAFARALRRCREAGAAMALRHLAAGDVDRAADAFVSPAAWDRFEEDVTEGYGAIIRASADREEKHMVRKAAVTDAPRFGEKWIKRRSANLMQEITGEQRDSLKAVILANYADNKRPKFIVDQIKQRVGLLESQQQAVDRRYQLHLDAGMTEKRAQKLADQYADEQLDFRARRIAITETVAAEAQGKREAWAFLQERGDLPADQQREWIAADDACEECMAHDGEQVGLDEEYDGDDEIPLHPQCFCIETIV